jgi:hypothetical protein
MRQNKQTKNSANPRLKIWKGVGIVRHRRMEREDSSKVAFTIQGKTECF